MWGACPVLSIWGGADHGIGPEAVEQFSAALAAAGVEHRSIVYPDAPHSFFDRKAEQHADAIPTVRGDAPNWWTWGLATSSTGGYLRARQVQDLLPTAETMAAALRHAPPLVTLAAVMAMAMAATPFLNNAATVLIMAPIGAALAQLLGLSTEPFLMAVALGAACDFLTPVGHQCNTLVMGPGGYRFVDYPRLGAPLSLMVLIVGTGLIALVWPLGG